MHVEHLIFAVDPKCSGFVNLCKQSCNEIGGPEFRAGIFLEPLPPEAEFIEVLPEIYVLDRVSVMDWKALLQWFSFKNQQSPIDIINCPFSRGPDRC